MGLIYTDVTVQSLNGKSGSIASSFLVDTGAIDCLMSAERLREVGIEPESTDLYELADGRVLELPVGWARLTFMGTVAISKVVFGPKGSEPILGVIALETAGVSLDPSTHTLRRLTKRSLKVWTRCDYRLASLSDTSSCPLRVSLRNGVVGSTAANA